MIEFISQRWAPRLLSVLRIVTAFLFIAHGAQKLLGFPSPMTSPPALFSLIGLAGARSEEHTSELQSQFHLVCRLLLEKKKKNLAVRRQTHVGILAQRAASCPSCQSTHFS